MDPVFDGVNISIPRKVVEYYARNNWAKQGLKKIMMNFKGLFFFKFDSRAGLEAVLEGGPWLIGKSPIILKKWSMDTRLLKEELTRILIWVKFHDVPIQVFEEDVIPHIVTLNVVTPTVEKTNDSTKRYEPKATTSEPKKGVTNVGNTSQSSSMLKTTGNSSKKDNLFMSNSFSTLNDEEDDEEDV
nr:hypothetical protein [Tanacetum cinerariifolium]